MLHDWNWIGKNNNNKYFILIDKSEIVFFWQINVLQAKKKFEVLDAVSQMQSFYHHSVILYILFTHACILILYLLQMLSFMRAQYTLFQQGYNILDEIDPYMKKLAAQVRAKECRLMVFWCIFLKMLDLTQQTLTGAPCYFAPCSWTSWSLTQPWRRERWSTSMPWSSKGWDSCFKQIHSLLLLLYLQSLCHKIRASILYCSILVRVCKNKFSTHITGHR